MVEEEKQKQQKQLKKKNQSKETIPNSPKLKNGKSLKPNNETTSTTTTTTTTPTPTITTTITTTPTTTTTNGIEKRRKSIISNAMEKSISPSKSLPNSPIFSSNRKRYSSKLNRSHRSHSVDDFENGVSGPPMMQLSLED